MSNLYTQAQVTELAHTVGFTTAEARVAGAIAMAETNSIVNGVQYCDFGKIGDQALADATWGYSYGAFQVRSLRAQKGTGGFRDELKLPDPTFNTKSALTIYKASGFAAWSTYNSGAYKGFLQADYPVPAGTYRVTGGDSLSKIGYNTGYRWQDIALTNNILSPYTIYPGQTLLLPDFPYKVVSGDTLTNIVKKYASNQTVGYVAYYNNLSDPNKLSVGQQLDIPRLVPPIP